MMKLRRIAIAAATILVATTTTAQVTKPESTEGLTYKNGANAFTLYGLLDVTLSNQSNANSAGKSLTTLQEPWFSGSRWGVKGQHDLDRSGMKAIFKLESEFLTSTGAESTAGVLFNRDAWLGVESSELGKLTVGRQNTLARDFAGLYGDAYGKNKMDLEEGGFTNTNNFKHLVYYAGSATGTRYDRGVVWKKEFGNVVAGLGYQFGNTAGQVNQNTTKSAALAYNGNGYVVSGFYNTATVAGFTNNSASIGGNVQVTPLVRLNAGYFNYTADQKAGLAQRKDTATTLSLLFTPQGKTDYALGYQVMDAKDAAVNSSGYVINAFSDASALTAVASGKRKTLYTSAMHHMDKSTDFYAVFDRLYTTDGYFASSANGKKAQNEYGVGMRFKF